MSVPKKRRTSSSKKRRAVHHALKDQNLVKVDGQNVPHALKKAIEAKKKLKAN